MWLTFFSSWQWNHPAWQHVNDETCIFVIVVRLRTYKEITEVGRIYRMWKCVTTQKYAERMGSPVNGPRDR
jgi:hypothetical protein